MSGRLPALPDERCERWRSSMALLEGLALGEANAERGRTVKQAEAFRRARKQLEQTPGQTSRECRSSGRSG